MCGSAHPLCRPTSRRRCAPRPPRGQIKKSRQPGAKSGGRVLAGEVVTRRCLRSCRDATMFAGSRSPLSIRRSDRRYRRAAHGDAEDVDRAKIHTGTPCRHRARTQPCRDRADRKEHAHFRSEPRVIRSAGGASVGNQMVSAHSRKREKPRRATRCVVPASAAVFALPARAAEPPPLSQNHDCPKQLQLQFHPPRHRPTEATSKTKAWMWKSSRRRGRKQ